MKRTTVLLAASLVALWAAKPVDPTKPGGIQVPTIMATDLHLEKAHLQTMVVVAMLYYLWGFWQEWKTAHYDNRTLERERTRKMFEVKATFLVDEGIEVAKAARLEVAELARINGLVREVVDQPPPDFSNWEQRAEALARKLYDESPMESYFRQGVSEDRIGALQVWFTSHTTMLMGALMKPAEAQTEKYRSELHQVGHAVENFTKSQTLLPGHLDAFGRAVHQLRDDVKRLSSDIQRSEWLILYVWELGATVIFAAFATMLSLGGVWETIGHLNDAYCKSNACFPLK